LVVHLFWSCNLLEPLLLLLDFHHLFSYVLVRVLEHCYNLGCLIICSWGPRPFHESFSWFYPFWCGVSSSPRIHVVLGRL
jgi:hypothetical protein